MKRYLYGILALLTPMLGSWALTGCSDDVEPFTPETDGNCFSFEVKVPMEASTRAGETDPLNEFTVKSLHLYFYKDEGNENPTSASVYDCVYDAPFVTQTTITVPLPANALLENGLFGATGTECIVYAVANVDIKPLPEGKTEILPEGTAKTINELKATAVSSTFDVTKAQDAFVMDGQATVTIDRSTRRAAGTINLTRAAAKITLSVDLPTSITVNEGTADARTYTPNAGSMHVWIGNGVKNSKVNTDPVAAAEADLYSNAIDTGEGKGSAFKFDSTQEKYKYFQNVPFYSYPSLWDGKTPDGNCYLTLMVPWTLTDAEGNLIGEQTSTYYRIAVQPEECQIVRNTHYDIRVSISRLGDADPHTPVDIENAWSYALEWNTQGISAAIREVRYLLLNNNYYDNTLSAYAFEMNNETDIEIPVATSHDVKIASVTLSWIDYSQNPVETRSITLTPDGGTFKYNSNRESYVPETDFAGIEMDNSLKKLLLKRNMLHISGEGEPKWVEGHYEWQGWNQVWVEGHYEGTVITGNAALNTYTFDIELQHADDATQKAKVHITQYPPIYITAETTTDGSTTRFINNNNYDKNDQQSNSLGYLDQNDDGSYDELCIGSLHDDYANNKNTYIISITRFNNTETNNYIIADPRTRTVDNLLVDGTLTATWTENDGKRLLQNYYPTDRSDAKKRYIAPKIRIASQWGVTYHLTRKGAERRCASYQENGRPAGRWRVPTIAEIEFIANLSCNGYIPYLFGSSTDLTPEYWCASGAVMVHNGTNPYVSEPTNDDIRAVRCVYDEWYWGDDVLADKTKFTWGDRPRD